MALVRYFAAARDAAGVDQEERSEATLGELRQAITAEHLALGGILPRCAVLVTGERTEEDRILAPHDVIDVLPPFAGG